MRGPEDRHSHPDRNVLDGSEREGKEEETNEQEEQGGEECVISDQDYDTDLEFRGIEKLGFWIEKREIIRIIITFIIKGAMVCFIKKKVGKLRGDQTVILCLK